MDHSLPASAVATPQRSCRPSFDRTPPGERPTPPGETDELADHLRRSLAVHAQNDRRSASATPIERSSARASSLQPDPHAEDPKGKSKIRSSSIGFFGSRKARSKSRVQTSHSTAGHTSDLLQVEEEGERGRRGTTDRPPLEHSGSSGGAVVTPGSEGEGAWT